MIAPHAALTTAEVVAPGGWHPRYARVIAAASAGGHGFALVDGNGDGSEPEAGHWLWHEGSWQPGGSSGAGPLDAVGPLHSGGHADDSAWFAYGHGASSACPANTSAAAKPQAETPLDTRTPDIAQKIM